VDLCGYARFVGRRQEKWLPDDGWREAREMRIGHDEKVELERVEAVQDEDG